MTDIKSTVSDAPPVVLNNTEKSDASKGQPSGPLSLDTDPSWHSPSTNKVKFRSIFEVHAAISATRKRPRKLSRTKALSVGVLVAAAQAKQKYTDYVDAISDPAILQAEVGRLEFEAEMRKWDAHFAKHAIELKENYYDWYITLDYENGNHTIGPSRAASKAAFEEKYGARDRAYTGHIGTA
jgi:hypothetical protein